MALGPVYTAVVYLAGYLTLLFVALCVACGLYYLAELAEEHTATVKRIIKAANALVLLTHLALALTEPQLPKTALATGVAAHLAYQWLSNTFPAIKFYSLAFATSLAALIASHYMWIAYFLSHYHRSTHVFCFFVLNVWLVPFGFFVSLSVNERTLPDRLAQSAGEVYTEGGERVRQRSGIISAFNFFQKKRDEAMPSFGKRV